METPDARDTWQSKENFFPLNLPQYFLEFDETPKCFLNNNLSICCSRKGNNVNYSLLIKFIWCIFAWGYCFHHSLTLQILKEEIYFSDSRHFSENFLKIQ